MSRQPTTTRARRITVTIDALALRGMSAADARLVASTLEADLRRQLADAGTADFGASRRIAPARQARTAAPAAAPGELGSRAAAAIAAEVRR